MFTDILIGLGSMMAGALVAMLPYLGLRIWRRGATARPALPWMFMLWGALWVSQGIRYSIDSLR